jgi:hypothetical protein
VNIVVSLLVAFPLGLLLRSRSEAYIAYVALFLFLYVSTAVTLLVEWAGGSTIAFGPFPRADTGQMWSFVGLSAAAFVVGALLVQWGSVVQRRRAVRRTGAVDVAAA